MFANVGGVPFVGAHSGREDHRTDMSWGWIFALVIIFLALVFLWGRRDHEPRRDNQLVELAAITQMQPKHGHDGGYHTWDISRDQLRDFATLRHDMSQQGWMLTREIDGVKYNLSAEIKDSERRVLDKIADSEAQRLRDERDLYRLEATNLRFHPPYRYPSVVADPAFA